MRRAAAAPPPVQSKGGPRSARQANPKVLAIVGGVVVLAAVGDRARGRARRRRARQLQRTIRRSARSRTRCRARPTSTTLFKGIPQNGLTLGTPKAPVTMVEYIDLQCPICQQFETQVMPDIITKYVRTGKVKVEARVLDFIGPDSSRGRNAMIAAATAEQGVQLRRDPLLQPGHGEHRLADRRDGRAGGVEHSGRPRAQRPESRVLRIGLEPGQEPSTPSDAPTRCRARRRSSSARAARRASRSRSASPTDSKSVVTALDTRSSRRSPGICGFFRA